MKTIKAIRATKEVELGEIRRVDDKTAHNMVGNYWQYISKSEWKLETRKSEQSRNQAVTKTEPSSELTERKPYKKGSKPEKKSKKDEKGS